MITPHPWPHLVCRLPNDRSDPLSAKHLWSAPAPSSRINKRALPASKTTSSSRKRVESGFSGEPRQHCSSPLENNWFSWQIVSDDWYWGKMPCLGEPRARWVNGWCCIIDKVLLTCGTRCIRWPPPTAGLAPRWPPSSGHSSLRLRDTQANPWRGPQLKMGRSIYSQEVSEFVSSYNLIN